MDKLVAELMSDLSVELENEVDYDENILAVKVRGAIRDVANHRNYASLGYSKESMISDLYRYYANILNIARYDYNQIGAEGHSNYSEDGISRTWVKRETLFAGIVPLSVIC